MFSNSQTSLIFYNQFKCLKKKSKIEIKRENPSKEIGKEKIYTDNNIYTMYEHDWNKMKNFCEIKHPHYIQNSIYSDQEDKFVYVLR